ncbi:putative RNA polymerase beta prime subunit [Erwinia phage vB_EamM_Joad]|uniref:Putative RNA polymerase beta prime subunit n=1 Tax=Erwinia phage vB_EamM_Joad TaxID=2026081 RepID=A0A223LJX1_9CAUD|nr:putative RNA polymerase beta prime subunit [Erwinia phage vB_EamM_Joad]
MNIPDLTPSNELAIKALTNPRLNHFDPITDFMGFAQRYGGDLTDDPQFSKPLYFDFEDYDYLHDTSRLTPVYLNDFDFNLEEDRERLATLTRMDFSGNTFESIAVCSPDCGHLKGNYLIGSDRTCSKCGNKVERFLNRGSDTKLWLRLPEGVKAFVNIGVYNTFLTSITISNSGSPKICLPRYFIDPNYRKHENKRRITTLSVLHNVLSDLDIKEVNLNTFVDNYDRIMQYLLMGPGKRYTGLGERVTDMLALYHQTRKIVFNHYLKVPNRYSTVIERGDKDVYCAEGQLETTQIYYAIADTAKSDEYYQLSEKEILRNVEIVGKNLVKLTEQYGKVNNPKMIFHKKGLSRKHVCSGSIPMTGRSVITSQTGIMDPGNLEIPWKIALAILEYHIVGFLYRQAKTPWEAYRHMNLAAHEVDDLIDGFFRRMEDERKALIQAGRNPSIEYLSLRTFFLSVNRNLHDESIKLPILACAPMNADFDGDNEYLLFLLDLESKAKAYGAFGHHLMLDTNQLFKVNRYAAQAATNYMNLNIMMQNTPVVE